KKDKQLLGSGGWELWELLDLSWLEMVSGLKGGALPCGHCEGKRLFWQMAHSKVQEIKEVCFLLFFPDMENICWDAPARLCSGTRGFFVFLFLLKLCLFSRETSALVNGTYRPFKPN
ncbi:hypothetical protein DV515_00013062, partial [Chloebia gouldiae]